MYFLVKEEPTKLKHLNAALALLKDALWVLLRAVYANTTNPRMLCWCVDASIRTHKRPLLCWHSLETSCLPKMSKLKVENSSFLDRWEAVKLSLYLKRRKNFLNFFFNKYQTFVHQVFNFGRLCVWHRCSLPFEIVHAVLKRPNYPD